MVQCKNYLCDFFDKTVKNRCGLCKLTEEERELDWCDESEYDPSAIKIVGKCKEKPRRVVKRYYV